MTDQKLNIPSRFGKVSDAEWQTRVDLAAAYRLVAAFKWDDLVFTHITAKNSGCGELISDQSLRLDV